MQWERPQVTLPLVLGRGQRSSCHVAKAAQDAEGTNHK